MLCSRSRSSLLSLVLALGACGVDPGTAAQRSALCPVDNPDCNVPTEPLTYTLAATLSVPDHRAWCTASSARSACAGNGAPAPLRNAAVQIRNSSTYAVLKTVITDSSGHLQTTLPVGTGGVYFTTDWSGYSSGGKAFQVFYNPKVSQPGCLSSAANRQVTYGVSPAYSCSAAPGSTCDLGSRTLPLNNDQGKWAAEVFLNLIYAYRDSSLYVAKYHDYCRLNGCADVSYHVVSIYDPAQAQAEYEAGNTACVFSTSANNSTNWTVGSTGFTTLVGSTSNLDGGVEFHEFGHSLAAWAFDLQSATSGPNTPGEAWANFVSHAHKSKRDAAHVYFDNIDIEEGDPLTRCPGTPAEDCGKNWQAAFWDLYDTHADTQVYSCETANSGGVKGDRSALSFGDMLDGLGYFLSYPSSTQNHARCEDQGATNDSTRNVVDYAYNIAAANGQSYTPIEQTATYHNCMQALPTN